MSDPGAAGRPLILASASAGRAALLRNAGLDFSLQPARIDERALERAALGRAPDGGLNPGELALCLSEAKAQDVSRNAPDALVIGADQVMACGGRIFHKPADNAAAREQLRLLRGRTHSLYSALTVAQAGEPRWQHFDRADLTMRDFSDDFLDEYCRKEEPHLLASVGAYRIEGPGAQLFSRISGDVFTIIGLPLLPLLGYLRKIGWLMR